MKKKKNKKKNRKNAFQQYMDKYDTGGTVHNHPHDKTINPNTQPGQILGGDMFFSGDYFSGNFGAPQRPFYGQNAMVPSSKSQFNADPNNMYNWNNVDPKLSGLANYQGTGKVSPVEESSKEKITAPEGWWGDFQQMGNMSKQDMKMSQTPTTEVGIDEITAIGDSSASGVGGMGGGMDMGAMGGAMAGITDNINQTFQFIEAMKSLGKFSGRPGVYSENTGTKFALGGLTQNPTIEVEGGEVIETPDGQLLEAEGDSHNEDTDGDGNTGIVTNDVPAGSMVYSDAVKKEGKSMAARKKDREKYWSTIAEKAMADPQNAILISSMDRILQKNKLADEEDKKLMEAAKQEDERKTSANQLLDNFLNLNNTVNQVTSKLSASPTKYKKGGKVDYKYEHGGEVEPVKKKMVKTITDITPDMEAAAMRGAVIEQEWRKKKPTPEYSIVDYLDLNKQDSSKEARTKLAQEYGIENYDFSAEKNTELLNALKTPSISEDYQGPIEETLDDVDEIDPIPAQKSKIIHKYNLSPTQYKKFEKSGKTIEEWMNRPNKTFAKGGIIEEDPPPEFLDFSKLRSNAIVNPVEESRKSGMLMDLLDSDREKNLYNNNLNINLTPSAEQVNNPMWGNMSSPFMDHIKTTSSKDKGFSSQVSYNPNQDLSFTGKFNPNYADGQMNPDLGLGVGYKGFNADYSTDFETDDLNLTYDNPYANINYKTDLKGTDDLSAEAKYKNYISAKLNSNLKDAHEVDLSGKYKGFTNKLGADFDETGLDDYSIETGAKYKNIGLGLRGDFDNQGLSNYNIKANLGPFSGKFTGNPENNNQLNLNLKDTNLIDLLKANYNTNFKGDWDAGLEAEHRIGKTDMKGKITTDSEGNWKFNSGADIGFGNKGRISPSINATPEQIELALSSNIPINDKLAILAGVDYNPTKGDWSVEGGIKGKLNDMLNLKATMGYDSDNTLSGDVKLQALLNQQEATPDSRFAAKKHGGVVKYQDGGPVLPFDKYQDADAVIENIFKGDKLAYQKAVNAYIDKNKITDLVADKSGKNYTDVGEDKIIGDKSTSFLRSPYGQDFLESETGFKTIGSNIGSGVISPQNQPDITYDSDRGGYFYNNQKLAGIQGEGLYNPETFDYDEYVLTGKESPLIYDPPKKIKPQATDWADYMLNPSTKDLPAKLRKKKEEEQYDPETPKANWTQGDLTGMAGTMMGGLSPMMTTMMQQAATPKNTSFYETYMDRALGTMEGQKGFLGQEKSKALRDVSIASDTFDRKTRRDARSINTLRALGQVSNAQEQKMIADVYSNYAKQMMGLTGQIAQMQGQQDMVKMQGREKADLANRQDMDAFFTNINQDQRNMGTMLQKMGKDLNVKQGDIDFLSILPDLNKYGISMRRKADGGLEMFDSKTGKTASQAKVNSAVKKIKQNKK